MAYLLVNWDSDNSASVISQKVKGLPLEKGEISFKCPGKGIYNGTILATSGVLSYKRTCLFMILCNRLQETY